MLLTFKAFEPFDSGSLAMRRAIPADGSGGDIVIADFYFDAPRTLTVRAGDPSALWNLGAELNENIPLSASAGASTHYPVRVAESDTLSIATARECLAIALDRLFAAASPLRLDRDSFLGRQFGKAKLVAKCGLLLEQAALGTFKGWIVP